MKGSYGADPAIYSRRRERRLWAKKGSGRSRARASALRRKQPFTRSDQTAAHDHCRRSPALPAMPCPKFRIIRLDGWGDAICGTLECVDVDSLHSHHRVEGPPCAAAIGIADQPDKLAGNDLPRHTETVFHPAAFLSLGTAESASAKRSASAWVSTGIWNEIASLNWNCGPPFKPVNA